MSLTAGAIGAAVAWFLLSRQLATRSAAFRAETGVDLGAGIAGRAGEIMDFAMLVAGLGLLAWLLAARPGTP